MGTKGHAKKIGRNSQSVDNGVYIDCSCGKHVGRIWPTKAEADEEFKQHIVSVLARKEE